jgi:hypothetical protein
VPRLMNPEEGRTVIEILKHRCGEWTKVFLKNGQQLDVFNIGWGYGLGDDYAHVTTNTSPSSDEVKNIDFFYTNEVIRLEDADISRIIWSIEEET